MNLAEPESRWPTTSPEAISAIERFEQAWRATESAHSRPRIVDFLSKLSDQDQTTLFCRMLSFEIQVRLSRSETPQLTEYISQLPGAAPLIRKVFRDAGLSDLNDEPTADFQANDRTRQPVRRRTLVPGRLATAVDRPGLENASDLNFEVDAPGSRLPDLPGYEVTELVGAGGMGVVYKARDKTLNRVVALKMIQPSLVNSRSQMERFLTEAAVVARFHHPNLVQIYEIAEHQGVPYFSLEFVDGGNLREKIAAEPQPAADVVALGETLARAIDYAHSRGVIHRDLKPSNILLSADGVPKVADFGLAKEIDRDLERTIEGGIIGTPVYMSPEQAEGRNKEVGVASDVYSLGVILYEMMTGRPPFRGADKWQTLEQVCHQEPVPPRQLVPSVPRDLELICLRCLEKAIPDRFKSAGALADELQRFREGRPIETRPARVWERSWKWIQRQPALASLAAVSVVALLSLVLFLDQRARVATQQLAEQRRTTDLRAKVRVLQWNAQEAIDADRIDEAQGRLRAAAEIVRVEPSLADLQASLDEQNAVVKGKEADLAGVREAEATHRDILRGRETSLFHGLVIAGSDMTSDLAATKKACGDALALAGVTVAPSGGPVYSKYMPPERARECTFACYELLLAWAEAEARLVAQPADLRPQLETALRLLDRAAKLDVPATGAYRQRRANYLDRLGDADGAKRERAIAAKTPVSTALDHFLSGVTLQQDGKINDAASAFAAALREQPDHFWARYHLAVCNLQAQRPAQARDNLTACLNAKSDFLWLYLLRGFAYGQLNDFAAAEHDYARALTMKPSVQAHYGILVNWGSLHLRQARATDSLVPCPWLGIPASNIEFAVRGAGEARRDERLDAARKQLEAAVALDPAQPQAYRTLAMVAQKQKKLDEALQWLDRAVDAAKNRDAETRSHLFAQRARARRDLKLIAEAIADFHQAIELAPRADDFAERGRLQFALKKPREALDDYQAAIRLQIADPDVHRWRAEALVALSRDDQAAAAYDQHIALLSRPSADAFRARGTVHARLHNYPAALSDYTQSLALKPDSTTLSMRGWVFLANDVVALSLHDFDMALQLDPKNSEAYAGRGLVRARRGQQTAAFADAQAAISSARVETPRLLWNVAHIYAQLAAHLATEEGSKTPSAGVAYEQNQRYAVALLERALDRLPAAERRRFWNQYIAPDALLVPLRNSPQFQRLAGEFGGAPRDD